jgi:hypothetical protein
MVYENALNLITDLPLLADAVVRKVTLSEIVLSLILLHKSNNLK